MEFLRPEEMQEGRKYELVPNEEYSGSGRKIWYEILVEAQLGDEVRFEVTRSNAEHTIGRSVRFPHDHAIFRTRDILQIPTDSFQGTAHKIGNKTYTERTPEPPQPIEEYEMSTDFKKSLIDIALIFNDEEWFKELTGASNVG